MSAAWSSNSPRKKEKRASPNASLNLGLSNRLGLVRRSDAKSKVAAACILSGRLRVGTSTSPHWEFVPSFDIGQEFRLSRKFDLFSVSQARDRDREFVRVDGAYKRKGDKVRPAERWLSDGSMPG